MASVTGRTCVGIIFYAFVIAVYASFVAMRMTYNTTESGIIGRDSVTFRTECPCSLVPPTVNWEILRIVVVGRWSPCFG